MVSGEWLMGLVRALVAVVLIAVAASPMLSGRPGTGSTVPSVYADALSMSVYGKQDKDNERKEENRNRDEDEKGRREKTAEEKKEEKQQQEHDDDSPRNDTNTLSRDNFELEGTVVALNCDAQPKQIVIKTVDGEATLFSGPRETENRTDRLYCGDLLVGDYIFIHEGLKVNETAYEAYYISCQQEREEGPDNTNDNEDDLDPNCAPIFAR
jgi:hypothetical protein